MIEVEWEDDYSKSTFKRGYLKVWINGNEISLLATQFRFLFNIILIFTYLISFSLVANNSNYETDEVLSGYIFANLQPEVARDDDFLNPGMFWVENGETIWNKGRANGLSCNTCHGENTSMKGVSLKYQGFKEIKNLSTEQK